LGSRSAAAAESQVVQRKMRSPPAGRIRVGSPEERRHGGHPRHDGVEQAHLGRQQAKLPPQRSQVGLEDTDGDEVPEVIGGEVPGVVQSSLQ
jgi:hypothetical protein